MNCPLFVVLHTQCFELIAKSLIKEQCYHGDNVSTIIVCGFDICAERPDGRTDRARLPIFTTNIPSFSISLPMLFCFAKKLGWAKNLSNAMSCRPKLLQGIISKINRVPSENIHQFFLKWALGTHRKSSNIGTLGESGRYPLIYQSIKLTLDYYQRLTNLSQGSFVYAALQEQKLMMLPWYKNIESLMKTDEIFHQDHVSAYNRLKTQPNIHSNTTTSVTSTTLISSKKNLSFLGDLTKLKPVKPLPSKQFRARHVLKQLREHFRDCWEYDKSKSPKLAFYHTIKQNFQKEPYLDTTANSSNRYRTTRLRISAHDLEIESGRYKNIPRNNRICKWCSLTSSDNVTEDETHLLYDCGLYADLRTTLIYKLIKISSDCDDTFSLSSYIQCNQLTPQNAIMKLLSPNVTIHLNEDDPLHHHHLLKSQSHSATNSRAYIANAICSFIAKCFDKLRWSFLNNLPKA